MGAKFGYTCQACFNRQDSGDRACDLCHLNKVTQDEPVGYTKEQLGSGVRGLLYDQYTAGPNTVTLIGTTTIVTMWVAHSHYPDKTWRGLEKCSGSASTGNIDNIVVFFTKTDCQQYIDHNGYGAFMTPVAVQVNHPLVGQPCEIEETK